jgi:hypothetical protein
MLPLSPAKKRKQVVLLQISVSSMGPVFEAVLLPVKRG